MTTLVRQFEKQVQIPDDHRLTIDLPPDLPSGNVDVHVTMTFEYKNSAAKREIKRPEPKVATEAILDFAGIFADSETFAGDSVALIREIRNEW